MTKLTKKLNFSFKDDLDNSIKIYFNKDINIYETLCKYCADYNINLSDVTEEDFDNCVEIIQLYKEGNGYNEQDFFFFSI